MRTAKLTVRMSPSAPIPVTETPALPTAPALFQEWSAYLKPEDLSQIQAAYHFSESAHEGQFRKSGEPYIAHPLAVASILGQWHLDSQALTAALLLGEATPPDLRG